MAYYNKIGLLVLNDECTKFLVVQKSPDNVTADLIMPGGQFEEETIKECLKNEIKEELDCQVDFQTLEFISEYVDIAAGRSDRDVSIKLYRGKLIGTPTPSSEIVNLYWIGKKDLKNKQVSPIIRNKIIPDLVEREILK
jgi:8-oxo-dGTP pyrophosphatase MutT (NUDIX family)